MKNDYDYHRFAVSVNRRVGNAVQRNFIKRKMKELFRLNRHRVIENHDLWIVMKSRFNKEDAGEVREAEGLFTYAMKKMNRINGSKGK